MTQNKHVNLLREVFVLGPDVPPYKMGKAEEKGGGLL